MIHFTHLNSLDKKPGANIYSTAEKSKPKLTVHMTSLVNYLTREVEWEKILDIQWVLNLIFKQERR